MKIYSVFLLVLILFQFSCQQQIAEKTNRQLDFVPPLNTERMQLFDEEWKFSKTDKDDAISPEFDDDNWRIVDLPHDWSIEDLPKGEGVIGPFSKESPGGISTGFTIGGTGYYRKAFTLPEEEADKIFTIYFDGVYMESDVWINGHHLGFHPNGYTPFYYEMTDFLNAPGKENLLVVRAKNIGENSRWYSGSGIYRHVWLRVTDPINVPIWGISVKTTVLKEGMAKVEVNTELQNQGDATIDFEFHQEILNAEGNTIFQKKGSIEAGEKKIALRHKFDIESPKLWSVDHPNLYTLRTKVLLEGEVVDVEETSFGVRTFEFSPEKGFLLNGKSLILKGGCMHHDNGILGAATFDRAEQRRVEIMKANGFNAIRTSHNIPSLQFLDACDRLGMLVMDEAFDRWEHPKKPNDYHRYFKEWSKRDIQSMVLRDRNHPSIFAWSYGNEIYERADTAGIRIGKELIAAIKEIDTSLPVTQAICSFWEYKDRKRPWSDTDPAFELMDIHSYNYQWQQYENDHRLYPERVMVGSETFANEAFDNYKMALEKPYVIGGFVWTGMDYLGEAGIGQASLDSVSMSYPWFNGYCGDISILGFKKPQSYYRDVVWGRSKLEMAVEKPAPKGHEWKISAWGWRNELQSWNWNGQEGELLDVYVYSSAEKIELKLNDEIVSTQTATDTSKYIFQFKVPYEQGELKAIAYSNGEIVAQKSIATTGKASKIELKAEHELITTDKNDLAYIEVNLVDDAGQLVVDEDRVIKFEVTGDAQLIAVGNGNPTEMKSFQTDNCKTFQGRCLVILRPTGKQGSVSLQAYGDHLRTKKKIITIK